MTDLKELGFFIEQQQARPMRIRFANEYGEVVEQSIYGCWFAFKSNGEPLLNKSEGTVEFSSGVRAASALQRLHRISTH